MLIGQNDWSVFLLASESLMNAGRVHTVAHVLIGQKDWSVFRLASEIGTNAHCTVHSAQCTVHSAQLTFFLVKKKKNNTGTNVKSPPVLPK